MEKAEFVSKLGTGELRLLSEVLDHALVSGRRTADDFIHHFPPSAIMDSLDQHPRLRSVFLTVLVGLREKTAMRTPSGDAGRLLQAALEEGDTDSEAIVGTFDPDDRIRYLPPQRIWHFLTEGEFWKASRSKDAAGHKMAQAAIAYFIDRALAHGLATHADIVDGISVELLADKLPRAELTKIIRRALDLGRSGTPFKQQDFYEASPASVLVDHIGLPQLFDNVVMAVARTAGYADPPKSSAAASSPAASAAATLTASAAQVRAPTSAPAPVIGTGLADSSASGPPTAEAPWSVDSVALDPLEAKIN